MSDLSNLPGNFSFLLTVTSVCVTYKAKSHMLELYMCVGHSYNLVSVFVGIYHCLGLQPSV